MVKDTTKPVRRAVSLLISEPGGGEGFLAVLRPPDDAELPDLWGLPAGSVRPGESPEEAAARAGRDKLGVALDDVRERTSGTTERPGYRLRMTLFDARIRDGVPSVPQRVEGVTQYTEWRWARGELLEPAVARGSLCCRLYFESRD